MNRADHLRLITGRVPERAGVQTYLPTHGLRAEPESVETPYEPRYRVVGKRGDAARPPTPGTHGLDSGSILDGDSGCQHVDQLFTRVFVGGRVSRRVEDARASATALDARASSSKARDNEAFEMKPRGRDVHPKPTRHGCSVQSVGGARKLDSIRFRAHLSLIVRGASDTSSADRSPTAAIVVSRASWDYCANGGWVFKVGSARARLRQPRRKNSRSSLWMISLSGRRATDRPGRESHRSLLYSHGKRHHDARRRSSRHSVILMVPRSNSARVRLASDPMR